MKSFPLTSFLASFLASLAASAAVSAPPSSEFVSYDGYKVFRIKTNGRAAATAVEAKLSSLSSYEQWNQDIDIHIDVAISPEQLASFDALGLEAHVMHGNLGASIAAESTSTPLKYMKRQAGGNSSWYDSYHNYEDHIQYFEDLQAAFPGNSELVSSGTSYQGRDIYGLHLWGAGGPGKPVVLYHGTVHAREWVTAPVCIHLVQLTLLPEERSNRSLPRRSSTSQSS